MIGGQFNVIYKIWLLENITRGASSEFVSSSIPSWQILTAHAQPFRGARDLAFCLKVLLDSLLVWASRGGSGETARMRRFAWTFAARIGDKYQIRLTRLIMSLYIWDRWSIIWQSASRNIFEIVLYKLNSLLFLETVVFERSVSARWRISTVCYGLLDSKL